LRLHELVNLAKLLAFRFLKEAVAWTPIRFAE
jgi:hypothetical protein